MGQILHGSATTTKTIRRAIQNSQECLRVLARRYSTNQMAKKIERAREWRSYTSNSVKYDLYLELMEKMRAQNASFCDSNTVKYESVDQFLECGLMASNANSK